MARFILRFRGTGAAPPADLDRIAAVPGVELIDVAARMLLVAGSERLLRRTVSAMPGWVMSPERAVPLPDARRRPRGAR